MNNVTIKSMDSVNINKKMNLNDGDLLLVFNKQEFVFGTYLVVPFRKKGTDGSCYSTASHCSLINLDTGKLAFDEKCSRSTTMNRVICHLDNSYTYQGGDSHLSYNNPRGWSIKQYKSGNFKLEISLEKEEI